MFELKTLEFEGKGKCTDSKTAEMQLFGLYFL